jgi:hypothetical protein
MGHAGVALDSWARDLTLSERRDKLQKSPPCLAHLGPLWKEWHTAALEAENHILRQLGFTIYWIPGQHPHKFVVYLLRILNLKDKQMAQRAWNYCNDACRLDLCLLYESHVIACAAVHVAALDQRQLLPCEPKAWWNYFCGDGHDNDLSQIANAILSLSSNAQALDLLVASHAMVKSLVKDVGSFNDPESFVWEYTFQTL